MRKANQEATPVPPPEVNGEPVSKGTEEIARQAMKFKSRITILTLRQRFLKKNGYYKDSAQFACPEIYLCVLVEQVSFPFSIFFHHFFFFLFF